MCCELGLITLLVGPIMLAVGISTASAQTDDPARPVLGQTGQIFALKFVPGSKKLTVELAGKPAVTVGSERIIILGKQFPANSAEGKPLNIIPNKNAFEILDALDPNATLEIEIHDRTTSKKETFKVQQKPRP